jgi:hypothetical protein
VQRALKHSEEEDTQQDSELSKLAQEIEQIKQAINKSQVSENSDYVDEK